ncbi:hypothetical protein FEM48_Zijuj11G0028500 [Ziziphus jujuba var. spinosa]|uniref:WRKY domain-containing protein n=1 Tax=Ziziphus jujuba var. spinosa TaxID=714518 RepID=A0A978UGE0_ZIZJJ|nr:hypothetical protein FEM48_Zijuj11G0028500 [Ziziphus jujuba var. spinosa]
MENWDLQSVVKGCCTTSTLGAPTSSVFMESFTSSSSSSSSSPCCNLLPFRNPEDDIFHSFPHLFETTTALDELEQLYKPFCPPALHPLISSPTVVTSLMDVPKEVELPEKKPKDMKDSVIKHKRRKNQQKRVVKEVKEDGLSSDMWAWRKYGQKPIKGSPYPRSYYRCSSSKGCPARKQVERSSSNPEIFIITYTAEHIHAHPVRRNSLSGSSRSKFPASSKHKSDKKNSCLVESIEDDELVQTVRVKKEEEQEQVVDVEIERNEIEMMDMMLSHEGTIPSSSSEDFVDNKQTSLEPDMDSRFLDDQFFSDGFVDAWFLDQPAKLSSLDDSLNSNSEDYSTWGLSNLDRFLNEAEEEEEDDDEE